MFGEENFSGRLPYTYPKYDGVIEFYDHPRSVDRSKSNDFKAYNPQWDFGYGLNYSKVVYSNLRLDSKEMRSKDSIKVEVEITNSSLIDVKEVVQLYVSDKFATIVPNGKSLKRFTKRMIKAGETETVSFYLTLSDLEFVDASGKWNAETGAFDITIGNLITTFNLKI